MMFVSPDHAFDRKTGGIAPQITVICYTALCNRSSSAYDHEYDIAKLTARILSVVLIRTFPVYKSREERQAPRRSLMRSDQEKQK